jgi:hypothetical protein
MIGSLQPKQWLDGQSTIWFATQRLISTLWARVGTGSAQNKRRCISPRGASLIGQRQRPGRKSTNRTGSAGASTTVWAATAAGFGFGLRVDLGSRVGGGLGANRVSPALRARQTAPAILLRETPTASAISDSERFSVHNVVTASIIAASEAPSSRRRRGRDAVPQASP